MNGKIRYFSMFTGVGGFELGLEDAGNSANLSERWKTNSRSPSDIQSSRNKSSNETEYTCVGFSEIDKYASQLLTKRFPNIINYGDATKIDATKLPDFDMLCGGFPCQAFSIAGKRGGFEDTRGTLFFEVARILKVKRPKFIFLENVKGLLNHNKGETFKVIIQTLEELGYGVQWMVLNSKFFGVPQNRERVFIIGNIRGEPRPEILPFSADSKKAFKLQGQQTNTLTRNYEKGQSTGSYVIECEQLQKGEPMIRRLTPIECERLQGFPDNWTEGFSDTQRYKMMGNAVTTNVIKAIGIKILKICKLDKEVQNG